MDQIASTVDSSGHLELGLFGANGTGIGMTKVPERWYPSWEGNRDLVLAAEAAGLEFHIPFARWKGFGGESDPLGVTLEPIAWAAGLLAITSRIIVYATVHTPYVHPIVAAKQLATLDQIGAGRVAVNIVSAWNQDEFDMFGMEQREHDERYEYTREWLEVVREMWTRGEPFDYDGRFFRLRALTGAPKPRGGKITVMSAGASKAGRRFAMAHCDRLFTILVSPELCRDEVAGVKAAASSAGRHVDVCTAAYVICRPTQKEAEQYNDYFSREMADWPATDNCMRLLGLSSQSFSPEHYKLFRSRFAGGHGNYPIVGDPDRVAEEMKHVRDAGIRALAISFVDFAAELPYFRDEVLPRLVSMGVRRPA
jgi:alkanesulfonate monooxygenase SsuD/methylene tetrahydromethanopterin reductase-like flavin-dependent oxidoreductase (luciferase family)